MTTLPHPKAEGWRWADLALARRLGDTPAAANDGAMPTWLTDAPRRLAMVGGRVVAVDDLDTGSAPDANARPHALADMAASAHGALLDVEGDGGTVEIAHHATAGVAHAAHRLRLAPGARLTLVEHFDDMGADAWTNLRLDADVGEGAELTRVLLVRGLAALNTERVGVRLAANARFRQVALVAGGSSARTEADVTLAGPGARADIDGVLLGRRGQGFDATVRVNHDTVDSSSGQRWRLVADERAQVSIAAGVNVARDAQRTDATQSLRGLVLARTAAVNARPELEILADDVSCAHGCAVGELDRNALFYLRSRGIPTADARALLVGAFVADGLAGIADAQLRGILEAAAQAWLEHRA